MTIAKDVQVGDYVLVERHFSRYSRNIGWYGVVRTSKWYLLLRNSNEIVLGKNVDGKGKKESYRLDAPMCISKLS